jgi:hypothetical protein
MHLNKISHQHQRLSNSASGLRHAGAEEGRTPKKRLTTGGTNLLGPNDVSSCSGYREQTRSGLSVFRMVNFALVVALHTYGTKAQKAVTALVSLVIERAFRGDWRVRPFLHPRVGVVTDKRSSLWHL